MPTPELGRLIYRSRSVLCPTDQYSFRQILKVSNHNNRRDNLAGALVLLDGYFVQVLEGSRSRISSLMQRVRSDNRHSDIDVLGDWPITARLFAGFSMAKLDADVLDPATANFVVNGTCGYQLTSTLAELRDKNFSPYRSI